MIELPTRALSLYAPWCWAILHAAKDLENRNWRPTSGEAKFRGPFWLQASMFGGDKGARLLDLERECAAAFDIYWTVCDANGSAPMFTLREVIDWSIAARGKIVGRARVVETVEESDSIWYCGPLGLVLADATPLVHQFECKGALGFWSVPAPVLEQLRSAA